MSSHRILVALDGSSCSNAAAEVALQVTKSLPDTRLIGLHVVNVNPPSGNILKDVPGRIGFEPAVSPETNLAHEEDGASVLDQFRARADELGVHVECVMEHGAVHDVITHHAKHADLLITGLRGETEDRFPGQGGAHVSHLLQDVTVPMLIVPSNKAAIRSVAIGYDGSAGAAHALSAVRNYLSELLTAVHAIYVRESGEGDPSPLEDVVEHMEGCNVQTHVVDGDNVHEALATTAHETGADVLALGFRGRSRMRDFLFGSATEYIVLNTDLIILVAH